MILNMVGGGGGLSKCSVIVHIDTGSTVGVYTDPACTALVKNCREIGTSGDYLITGLPTGTYYIMAEKGEEATASSALALSAYGVLDLILSYAVPIFGLAYQGWNTLDNNMTKLDVSGAYRQFTNNSPYVRLYTQNGNQIGYSIIWKTAIPTGKRYLNLRYKKSGSSGNTIGLSSSSSAVVSLASADIPNSEAETVMSLPVSSVTGTAYVYIGGSAGGTTLDIREVYLT